MLLNLFKKYSIPDELPFEMQKIVDELKRLENKSEVLEKAYKIMIHKYKGKRFGTYIRLPFIFVHDVSKLWRRSGFLHCTAMNYLLRVLLIKSGKFNEDDIQYKYSLVWYISPHQYLRIKLAANKFINVDVWNANYGKGLGDYAHGFY